MCEEVSWYRNVLLAYTVVCAVGSLLVVAHPAFQSARYNWLRCIILILMVGVYLPTLPWMKTFDKSLVPNVNSWDWTLGCLVCIVSTLPYAFKVPERFSPGTFDNLGASH